MKTDGKVESQDYEMADGEEMVDNMNGTDAALRQLKDEERKLFVGGLSWETTEKELRDYFSKFGEVESVNIKTDSNTGRSRGFSFVMFKDAESVDRVFEAGDHIINNKKVDPKKAKLRPGKIFVGGITSEITDEDIKNHFSQYGVITATEMPFDKIKGQRKNFCFVSFESDQIVQDILKNPKQTIKGKLVDVKKATTKPGEGFMLGMRGRGRGRGGIMRGAAMVARGGYAPMAGYPVDYSSYYGYGDYYGYGAGYGYGDYYAADPYGYGYDYSGYGYEAAYPSVAPVPPAAGMAARGRAKPPVATTASKRGGRGFRHTPY